MLSCGLEGQEHWANKQSACFECWAKFNLEDTHN
jgi:hypothetical protein